MASNNEPRSVESGPVAEPTVCVVGLIRVASPFNSNQEDWIEYAKRLDYYFTTNKITDVTKKREILLNGAGIFKYRLSKMLLLPGTSKDLTIEEILLRVTTHTIQSRPRLLNVSSSMDVFRRTENQSLNSSWQSARSLSMAHF